MKTTSSRCELPLVECVHAAPLGEENTPERIHQVLLDGEAMVIQEQMAQAAKPTPDQIFCELDLGPGDYAIAPASEVERGMQEALRRKLGR